jgi:hypothetical protein
MFWIFSTSSLVTSAPTLQSHKEVKFKDIPVLPSYGGNGSKSFWDKFPHNNLPTEPETRIDRGKLRSIIEEKSQFLLKSERTRAEKCMDYLCNGGPSFQLEQLGSCCVKNSKQATDHGVTVTDTIASWVEKKFVAGPFLNPPLPNFRANSILAVPQPNKVRICLNVSLPENRSFNDNIDTFELEKIKMSSARLVGHTILEAGKNCTIAKTDIVDAYKNVPAKISDLHLQGFKWEGRFFVELRQIFGARSAVQNFDVMANTVKTLAAAGLDIPARFIHRQLDDTPVIAPASKNWCNAFLDNYKSICEKINLELAPDCQQHDKSFGPTKMGKILGIWFNTTDLTWRLSDEKVSATIQSIKTVLTAVHPSLHEFQSLMGRLNYIATMCPFMNIFKFNLNQILAKLTRNQPASLDTKSRQDLQVWGNFLTYPTRWLPICPPKDDPPLATISFTTDAAGFSENSKWSGNIGCGVIGTDAANDTILGFQMWWPKNFITSATDNKGKRFGNKTATLEMVALLLPLLLIPGKLRNSHILMHTDNASCVFGMKDGYVKNDEYASIFIRTAHLIGAYLGSVLHVIHAPRRSTWETITADNLSRESTTTFLESQICSRYRHLKIPEFLQHWLENPTDDWRLPTYALKHVMSET